MAKSSRFNTEFRCEYGVIEPLTPMVRRVVAPNPGPFTFKDCIAKISRKNGSRGSILQQLLGNVCQNRSVSFTDWVLDQHERDAEEQGGEDE